MKWFLPICLRALLLVSLLGLVNQTANATPLRQTTGPQYEVQVGDTLFDIALRFGVTVDALQTANPDLNPDALTIGQLLVIPGFEGLNGTLTTYRLTPGESLASLALKFGLKRETLLRLNRIVNPERLYVNEALVLIDQPDAGEPISTSTTYALQPGGSLLAFAAAHNQNPWALAAANRLTDTTVVPGTALIVPGGEFATKALPYPILDVQLAPFPLVQGQTVALKIVTAEPLSLTGQLNTWGLRFVNPEPNTYYALQGIHRFTEANLYPLTLHASATDWQWDFVQAVPMRAGDYLVDLPLTVDPATVDPANTEPENTLIASIVSPTTSTKLWNDIWVYPSVGAFRSMYGSLRSYNGGPYEFFHTGVDFSGGEDRAITAPAPGVVAYVGPLTVRGNVTLIDHGWGIFTGYWHQSQMVVNVGDQVTTGQIIGYNGATGRVTGPHLHWELFVGGVQVNPLQWTEQVFP